jgi:trans-2,3-dihydro-3-hydroxyanthranilate isomerase
MTHKYLHYDVFTNEPFRGNQLAVFTDARGMEPWRMQAFAREMNFSESTFILPAEAAGTDIRMRIFTPGIELPMAGHPTIGSTFALAHAGVIRPGTNRFVFGLGIGPTPVDLEWDGGRLRFAWMTQRNPEFGPEVKDRQAVAEALGLGDMDLHPDLPVQQVSCGVPFVMVPLKDRQTVDRAVSDAAAFNRLGAILQGVRELFLFAPSRPEDEVTAYSRMFAPGLGIVEDPATGSASGPLGSYLVQHSVVSGAEARRMMSLQGVAMGRDSRIYISISGSRNAITQVKVGGEAVLVGQGELLA